MEYKAQKYSAALYMRLSKDDGIGESVSITTQRKMLRRFAKENNYDIFDEYVDDGISGTTFERPEFNRMINDIENKKINMVITKDLSRLGRDYILAGQYTEIYFPSKKVRFIAINDGYDSENSYCDIVPFKNIINEMYARDTSKKIRSAFTTRMQEGAFIGAFAPYGYEKDPLDRHHLVVDDESAKNVKEIFNLAVKGVLPIQIAKKLNEKGVPTPIEYRYLKNPTLNSENYSEEHQWTSSTIKKIINNPVYIGNMAQGKTTKISFKSNTTVYNPKDEWFIVEHTHEPIVSKEVFDVAVRRSKQRTCIKSGQFNNLFSGIAKCADCGHNMSTVGTRKKGSAANLACGRYKLYGANKCTNHFIDYDSLYKIVLNEINEQLRSLINDKDEILECVQNRLKKQNKENNLNNEIDMMKRRSLELDLIINKLYEDYSKGLIDSRQMEKMLKKYELENKENSGKLQVLETQGMQDEQNGIKNKIMLEIDGFTSLTKLTQEVLYWFVDRIEIGQGEYIKTDGVSVKHQTIKIIFKFKGKQAEKEYIV